MKKKILLGSTALVLMLIGAMFFIPVSVLSTTTTPALYGTNVPTADSTDNNVSADVIGNKEDAAAAGAVSTTESLMAYAKQNVTNTEAISADSGYIADDALPADPTANSLAAFIASGGTALGQELPDSTSIVDIFGDFTGPHDGAAQDDNIKASLDLAHTDLDAVLDGEAKGQWITKSTVTSSEIPDDAQTAPIATVSTGGAWLSDIIVQTDATGLAAPTNIEISIDNSKGAYTDESEPICVEVIGSFGANVTFVKSDLDTDNLPVYVEAGKSVYIHGDDTGGTGAGTADVILKWEAAELAATITESDVSP